MRHLSAFLSLALVVGLVGLAGCDAAGSVDAAQVAATADASPNSAFVSNSGRDDQTCTLTTVDYGTGSGSATLVINKNNTTFRCAGSLDDASLAPDRSEKIFGGGPFGTSCQINITPSGNFSGVCH